MTWLKPVVFFAVKVFMKRMEKLTAGRITLTCLHRNVAAVPEPFWKITSLLWTAFGILSVSFAGSVSCISVMLLTNVYLMYMRLLIIKCLNYYKNNGIRITSPASVCVYRSASLHLWMAVSLSMTASPTVRCITMSAVAPSAPAVRSQSQVAVSQPCPRNFTRSTLSAPSAWNSSTKAPLKNKTTNPTAIAALSSCSVRELDRAFNRTTYGPGFR